MEKQVIEYAGQPVGIAVPEDGKLKFVAVKYAVMDLDNRFYPSVVEVKPPEKKYSGRLKSIQAAWLRWIT
jgi:hypothetical protein